MTCHEPIHPLPWRNGDPTQGERAWVVLDARSNVVLDCCSDDPRQSLEQASAKAARIAAAANND